MRTLFKYALMAAVGASWVFGGNGCSPAPSDESQAKVESHHHDDDDDHHHHDDDDHDHDHDDEGHHHEPPHGGTLIELGDHVAHLELLHDSDAGTLTAYAFDGHAETAVRLETESIVLHVETESGAEPLALTLPGIANSLTGETMGDTSEFKVSDDALKGLESFNITIPEITIRGATFTDVTFPFPEGNE